MFSHVKISSFRAKAHLVFHWCLYNKANYLFDFLCKGMDCSPSEISVLFKCSHELGALCKVNLIRQLSLRNISIIIITVCYYDQIDKFSRI